MGAIPTAEAGGLIALFNSGRFQELEQRALILLEQFPESGLVWKILGATLQVQGKDSIPALQKATELLPDDAEAHYNLGNSFLKLGMLHDAQASYRQALRINPGDADAHFNMGNTLRGLGRLMDAGDSYRKALHFRPAFAEACSNLGNIMLEQGRPDDAEACYRRAQQLNPGYAVAHFNLGNFFHEQGRLAEAEASYRRALQIRPDYVEAHGNLGKLLHELGRLPEAETCYRCALHIKTDLPEVSCNLGNTLRELNRLADAEFCYRWALRIKPDLAEAHCNLGGVLQELGRTDEAEASIRRALQLKPDYAEACRSLGNVLLELGRFEEAESCLHRALEIKPDFIAARHSVAIARKVKPDDANLAELIAAEKLVHDGTLTLPGRERMLLHFALGKSYDDLGEHLRAFPHFLEACRMKRATCNYDPEWQARYFTEIMQNFDVATLKRLQGTGNPSHVPIFVLGMPRSGTTLTEQIIASHPAVHGAGELPYLLNLAQREIAGCSFPDSMRLLDQEQLAAWGTDYLARLQQHAPGARFVTDKMPANFLAVGLIHLMLPNAKIVHVMRDPVDTCLSCFTTLFWHGQEHTYDLAELGRYYADYVRLMEHWRRLLPRDAFLEVRYEDLVTDQESQARRLIEYCGLEWHDACREFHRNKSTVRTASVTQVRQPIYRSSMQRWRPYEQFLAPLFEALGDADPGRN